MTRNPVRRMDGPFVTRSCVRTPNGYRWAEQDKAGGDYLDASQLEALRAALPEGALPPQRSEGGVTVWPLVPTPSLLCDRAFSRDREGLVPACERLGSFLALLHNTRPVPLPVRTAPAWLPDGSASAQAVAAARTLLGATELARSAGRLPPYAGESVIVHGRFSTGICVATGEPAVLGWREAGLGDPLRDVAFFLSELLEAAAVTKAQFDEEISVFLGAYGAVTDSERLVQLVADRLLEHYAQSTLIHGMHAEVIDVVRAAEKEWSHFAVEASV